MTIKSIAFLDASNNAAQYIATADWQGQLAAGWVDGTGGGYLWHRDPASKAWTDTAAAQTWRTQQANADAAAAPLNIARIHAAAVAADVEGRVIATGHTMNELFMRLLASEIGRVAAGSRTQLEKDFLTAVSAADAETP